MKWKQIYFILSLLFIGSLLCGCAQAPDEVVKNKEEYGDNMQVEETPVTKCTIDTLRLSSIDTITQEYKNIELPSHIDFSGIQDINLMTFQFVKDYRNEKEKYAIAFGLADNLEWHEVNGIQKGDTGLIYDSEARKEYMGILDNGTISFQQKSGYFALLEESEEVETEEEEESAVIEKRIYLKRGDPLEGTVNLNGKEVLLSDEVDWANKKINEIMSIDGSFVYDIRTVYVRKMKNGYNRLSLLGQMQYHGVTLDFYGATMEFDTENAAGYMKQIDNYVEIDMDFDKEITTYMNNGLYEILNEEPVEQVIDFQSAVDIVEREMSGFHKIKIEEIQLLYTLFPKYEYKDNKVYYGAPGNVVETRPVYSFMVKSGEDASTSGGSEGNELCYINVDMITGEVTNNFEDGGYSFQ